MPDNAAPAADATADSQDTATEPAVDLAAEVEKWKRLARKHEERAKTNADAAAELEAVRRQAMSDQERAVADALVQGRREAIAEFGSKLVAAELRAALAGRIEDERMGVILGGLNLAAFLDDDGQVDAKSIAQFAAGLAPEPAEPTNAQPQQRVFPDLGQGARESAATPLNGDPLMLAVQKKLGISN